MKIRKDLFAGLVYKSAKKRYPKMPGHLIRRLIRTHEHCVICAHNWEYDDYNLPDICCCLFDREVEQIDQRRINESPERMEQESCTSI